MTFEQDQTELCKLATQSGQLSEEQRTKLVELRERTEIATSLRNHHTQEAHRLTDAVESLVAYLTIYSEKAILSAADYIESDRFCSEEQDKKFCSLIAQFMREKVENRDGY